MAWQCFGVSRFSSTEGKLIEIPSGSQLSLECDVPIVSEALITGSVGIRITSPTHIKIIYEIFRNQISIQKHGQILFELDDPNVSEVNWREKSMNFQVFDSFSTFTTVATLETVKEKKFKEKKKKSWKGTNLKLNPKLNPIVYKLVLTNQSFLPNTQSYVAVEIDYLTFNIMGNTTSSVHSGYLQTRSLNASFPYVPTRLSIPANDNRSLHLLIPSIGGNIQIAFVLSIANLSHQTYQPRLKFDIQKDFKSLIYGGQTLISVPSIIYPQAGRNEFQASFNFVAPNVSPGNHIYTLFLQNQTINSDHKPTFIEIVLLNFTITALISQSPKFPTPLQNQIQVHQAFPSSQSNIGIILSPGTRNRFCINVPRCVKWVLIQALFNIESQKQVCEITFDLLRDNESINSFDGPHLMQVPFAARRFVMEKGLPITFLDCPYERNSEFASSSISSKDIMSSWPEFTYTIELGNLSESLDPTGGGYATINYHSMIAFFAT